MNKVPDRWLPYSSLGQPIAGTRFIAFKVPLKEEICKNLKKKERFTPSMLLEQCPQLALIVDLTNTQRYYDKKEFESQGLLYEKIFCPGKIIPPLEIVNRFFDIVDAFLATVTDSDSLIGVHCTHGLNRTAYFICSYMINRMRFPAKEAITAFERARGHQIEREEYVRDLLRDMEPHPESVANGYHRGRYQSYTSPSSLSALYDGSDRDRRDRPLQRYSSGREEYRHPSDYSPLAWQKPSTTDSGTSIYSGRNLGYGGDGEFSRSQRWRTLEDDAGGPGNSRSIPFQDDARVPRPSRFDGARRPLVNPLQQDIRGARKPPLFDSPRQPWTEDIGNEVTKPALLDDPARLENTNRGTRKPPLLDSPRDPWSEEFGSGGVQKPALLNSPWPENSSKGPQKPALFDTPSPNNTGSGVRKPSLLGDSPRRPWDKDTSISTQKPALHDSPPHDNSGSRAWKPELGDSPPPEEFGRRARKPVALGSPPPENFGRRTRKLDSPPRENYGKRSRRSSHLDSSPPDNYGRRSRRSSHLDTPPPDNYDKRGRRSSHFDSPPSDHFDRRARRSALLDSPPREISGRRGRRPSHLDSPPPGYSDRRVRKPTRFDSPSRDNFGKRGRRSSHVDSPPPENSAKRGRKPALLDSPAPQDSDKKARRPPLLDLPPIETLFRSSSPKNFGNRAQKRALLGDSPMHLWSENSRIQTRKPPLLEFPLPSQKKPLLETPGLPWPENVSTTFRKPALLETPRLENVDSAMRRPLLVDPSYPLWSGSTSHVTRSPPIIDLTRESWPNNQDDDTRRSQLHDFPNRSWHNPEDGAWKPSQFEDVGDSARRQPLLDSPRPLHPEMMHDDSGRPQWPENADSHIRKPPLLNFPGGTRPENPIDGTHRKMPLLDFPRSSLPENVRHSAQNRPLLDFPEPPWPNDANDDINPFPRTGHSNMGIREYGNSGPAHCDAVYNR